LAALCSSLSYLASNVLPGFFLLELLDDWAFDEERLSMDSCDCECRFEGSDYLFSDIECLFDDSFDDCDPNFSEFD
jgi:hypothetical protein